MLGKAQCNRQVLLAKCTTRLRASIGIVHMGTSLFDSSAVSIIVKCRAACNCQAVVPPFLADALSKNRVGLSCKAVKFTLRKPRWARLLSMHIVCCGIWSSQHDERTFISGKVTDACSSKQVMAVQGDQESSSKSCYNPGPSHPHHMLLPAQNLLSAGAAWMVHRSYAHSTLPVVANIGQIRSLLTASYPAAYRLQAMQRYSEKIPGQPASAVFLIRQCFLRNSLIRVVDHLIVSKDLVILYTESKGKGSATDRSQN